MYYWTFGDRSEEMSSDRPGYCHSYPNWGTYTVTLQVVDNAFPPQSGSAIKSINVQPPVTIPTADFTYSLHCGGNQYQVCFDASLSSDPDGIYRYYWTFGDGSPETFSDQPTDIPHTYPSLGTYSVTLRVFDRSSPPQIGTITKSVTLTTSPTIPTADFTYQPNCNGIPNQVCYDASRSSDPDGFSQYIWTFGDGSPDMHWGQPMYLTHTYPSPGTYTVTLMAVDKEGQFGTITKSVIIPPGGVTVTTTTSTPPGPRPTTPGSLIMVIAALGLMGIFFRRLGR
jgi:PKD repeat protein